MDADGYEDARQQQIDDMEWCEECESIDVGFDDLNGTTFWCCYSCGRLLEFS